MFSFPIEKGDFQICYNRLPEGSMGSIAMSLLLGSSLAARNSVTASKLIAATEAVWCWIRGSAVDTMGLNRSEK